MRKQRSAPEFKEEAVRRCRAWLPGEEVGERVGVSVHSLYKWVKGVQPSHQS
jgi:transposase